MGKNGTKSVVLKTIKSSIINGTVSNDELREVRKLINDTIGKQPINFSDSKVKVEIDVDSDKIYNTLSNISNEINELADRLSNLDIKFRILEDEGYD